MGDGRDIQASPTAPAALSRGELAFALAGVFLTSLAFLGFQIAASRLLSLLVSYHFVFAVVSLAMLGLGIGGVIARYAFPGTMPPREALRVLAGANAVAALAMLAGLAMVLRLADQPWIAEPSGMLAVLGILLAPLVCAGVAFAHLFRCFGAVSGRVYGADLAGAALGCLLIIATLDLFGGIGGLLLAAVVAAAGALAFAWPARRGGGVLGATAVVVTVLGLVFAAFVTGRYDPHVPVGANPDKEIHDAVAGAAGGEIEASRWSSFGRTDLVGFGERRDYKDLYIDGTAGTPMYRFTGDFDAPGGVVEALVDEFPGFVPFLVGEDRPRERALVIGPGGGRDILLARMAGFAHVRAVEVNPDLVDLVRAESDYNGDLFGPRADVELRVDEGRSYVRRDAGGYDLVMLSLPVTNTSRSREGFALTESFLLTAEAISDYLDALSPHGELVVIAHDEAAILRLITTALVALEDRGVAVGEAMARLYVLGSFPFPVLVLRQQIVSEEESRALFVETQTRGYSLASSYFPGIGVPGAVSPVLQAMEQGRMAPGDVVRLAAERGADIASVRDDSPFFHHFDVGAPTAVVLVTAAAAGLTVVTLLGGLLAAGGGGIRARVLYPALFFLIGAGFMLIEVSLIQRFMLFLGQPLHVLAVVLFVLLAGMSIGSVASSRVVPVRMGAALGAAGAAAAAGIVVLWLALTPLFEATLSLSLSLRIAIAAVVLLPLGAVLGLPFPLGMRALALAGASERIPWMWAINGAASVLGASAAILIAMTFGLSAVLLSAGICYALVAAAGLGLRHAG